VTADAVGEASATAVAAASSVSEESSLESALSAEAMAKFDVQVHVSRSSAGVVAAHAVCAADMFDGARVELIVHSVSTMLRAMCLTSGESLGGVELVALGSAERARQLVLWNRAEAGLAASSCVASLWVCASAVCCVCARARGRACGAHGGRRGGCG